ASDIYNLGATLYHLLTGRPPFENEEPALIRAKIQHGLFPPPHDVATVRIPRPLEAICLKAMALLPEDRYRSARVLAEDIQRWIADEPVSAYSESILERTARWSRRHKSWAQAAALGLAGLFVVLAVATAVVHRAWMQEQAEHRESNG